MNVGLRVLVLISVIVHQVATRQIPNHKSHSYIQRGVFKDFSNLFNRFSPNKRGLNLLDDRAIKDINNFASEYDWLKKIKSTPGKRGWNLYNDLPYNYDNIIVNPTNPGKRCANLLDESCSNGGAFSAGGDSDWINRGNSPGKRSLGWNLMDDRNIPFSRDNTNGITPGKRCANLLDESCSNGGASYAGDDSDWINGGNSPGKRSLGWNLMDDRNIPFSRDNTNGITPGKRCANLLDESCSNGGASSAGGDSDWINGGNSPGKRSLGWNLMDDRNLPFSRDNTNGITPGKRCANLLDESCSNGGASYAGDDSDWINGGNSPGKRSLGWNLMDDRNLPFSRDNTNGITPGKRCANLLDESCSNGGASSAGGDSDWINGGNSPGK